MKQVGYKTLSGSYLLGKVNLKRDLLYFDEIYIDQKDIDEAIRILNSPRRIYNTKIITDPALTDNPQIRKEIDFRLSNLEFLNQKGLIKIINSDDVLRKLIISDNFDKKTIENISNAILMQTFSTSMRETLMEKLPANIDTEGSLKNIILSDILSILNIAAPTPILKNFNTSINNNFTKDYPLLEFVLNKFPIINDNISFEQLIDYRNDSNSQRKFLALRNWMIDISKGHYTFKEIEEKYQYLYADYEAHLKWHKIRTRKGNLKIITITTAEIAGDLVSFKWGKVAETFFNIIDNNSKLPELELNAPGKEIGYVYDINQKFKNKNS
ncbi:hypothetical protein FF125_15795 [Aureibaculum algae]|uniref:Uncharacterized protein n=1 Tax=Aureibaculum algae TaxID=2584122 RepID=A0A5B7TU25_9FLAO|nr:hypothetical protein [Aureibaculum algae]QCX39830.1 hypothetical protein FF125_15795 [Aureibaculum algae]